MYVVLMMLGIGCVIGAVVGGGIKMRGQDTQLEIPLLGSRRRELALAVIGALLLGWGGLQYHQEREREKEIIEGVVNSLGGVSAW